MGDHAEAALRLAYRALRIAEWSYDDIVGGPGYCPDCRNNFDYDQREHRPDCELAAALSAIRELLPDVAGEGE